jgi:hypothetical protein
VCALKTAAKNWISAYPSGSKVHPLAPDAREFRIRDIAHHLSMQCRYAGGVRRFYSVAEHSVHVANGVARRLRALGHGISRSLLCGQHGWPCYYVQWGLIHDASEAYLNDITKPVKHQNDLAGYRSAEKRLQACIAVWLGLGGEEPDIVKQVDTDILGTEARQLKSPVDPDWGNWFPDGKLPAAFPGVRVGLWSPARARREFLRLFDRLFPDHKE